jgi:nicotinamidase-related amidase
MKEQRPALIIVDMLKDYFDPSHPLPITAQARKIIDPLNNLIERFHERLWPVVFTTDAFEEGDFLFQSRLRPHAIKGTRGAEPIEELHRATGDLWLPKPRFSAFFKTGLESYLRDQGVTLCAVGGIATNFCVLTSVLDAVQNGFRAVLLKDCTAAQSDEIHHKTLSLYENTVLWPLLRVITSHELLAELEMLSGQA